MSDRVFRSHWTYRNTRSSIQKEHPTIDISDFCDDYDIENVKVIELKVFVAYIQGLL